MRSSRPCLVAEDERHPNLNGTTLGRLKACTTKHAGAAPDQVAVIDGAAAALDLSSATIGTDLHRVDELATQAWHPGEGAPITTAEQRQGTLQIALDGPGRQLAASPLNPVFTKPYDGSTSLVASRLGSPLVGGRCGLSRCLVQRPGVHRTGRLQRTRFHLGGDSRVHRPVQGQRSGRGGPRRDRREGAVVIGDHWQLSLAQRGGAWRWLRIASSQQ